MEDIGDHALRGSYLGRLRLARAVVPAEHVGLEGAAVVERPDLKRVVISARHHRDLFSLR